MAEQPSAQEIARLLKLSPHPEGGWFRETFRDETGDGGRAHSTAIYYLLEGGAAGRWHRVDSAEVWHWYAGAPLQLSMAQEGGALTTSLLGPDLSSGARPQVVIPPGQWQSALSLGAWTLVGCTVAPGFEFALFEMQPEGWEPGR